MNTTYKLLWIDDSEDFYESTQELMEDVVKENNMLPEIKYYVHYKEFKVEELDRFDKTIFNQYDQIIIDYALSTITGDQIIRELRSRGIYTDVVFYSSEFDTMRNEMKKTELLDGVFFADRNDLTVTVGHVIKKNLRREYDIANIRGLIMDSSSEFDYICRITAVSLFDLLSETKKTEVEEKVRSFVAEAQQKSTKNFNDLREKQGKAYVKKAIEHVEYVMNNKDRYQIMAMILREFDFEHNVSEGFADQYDIDVIKPRNKLAHSKLYYGECKRKLHITKDRQVKCKEECEKCTVEYSIEFCEELRKRLFEYYQLFQGIDFDVSAYLEKEKQLQGV